MRKRVKRASLKKVRITLAVFGVLSLLVALALKWVQWEGRLPWIYGVSGCGFLVLFGLLEIVHRKRRSNRASRGTKPFPATTSRRGAALIVALAALALVTALLAMGGARAQGLNTDARRAGRQARLRAAVWDAAWSRLRHADLAPGGIPASAVRERPDGVKTSVDVQKLGSERRGDPIRFALSVTAELERDRREAWSLVERNGVGEYRILTWVER